MVQDLSYNLCESLVENIGGVADIGKKTPPTPIAYLTQWKIVGNSEVHGNEIWSCGEYNATDGKYHILVQPLGGSIADIALTEPLRKVNNVADTIEFPSDTEGKALVTRRILSQNMGSLDWSASETNKPEIYRMMTTVNNLYKAVTDNTIAANILCTNYNTESAGKTFDRVKGCAVSTSQRIFVYDPDYNQSNSVAAFTSHVNGYNVIVELATPTTELVDAPQIAEADSYSMVISQGAKAVSWSSFETE